MIGDCSNIPMYYPPCWMNSPLDYHVKAIQDIVLLCGGKCAFEDVDDFLGESDISVYRLREMCETTGCLPNGGE